MAAVAPEFANSGGHYLDDANEAPVISDDTGPLTNPHAVKQWPIDPGAAQHLWTVSTELLEAVI